MAKRRTTRSRRPSAAQRDPYIISMAKLAKHRKILSPQTKLHGGKFVSRRVMKKIIDLEPQIDAGYRGLKAPRALVKQAKEKGYIVSNGRIVGPPGNTPQGRRFAKAIKGGQIVGVKPVSAGHMEIVEMPHDITDLKDLIDQYRTNPQLLDDLKTDDEMFLFKLYGNESYTPFYSTQAMLDYFLKYRSIFDAAGDLRTAILEDTFEQFQVFRFNPQDQSNFIRTREKRRKARAMRFSRDMRRAGSERMDEGREERQHLKRRSWRIDKRQMRAKWSDAKREAYNEKSRERMRRLRDSRKGDK